MFETLTEARSTKRPTWCAREVVKPVPVVVFFDDGTGCMSAITTYG